MQSTDHCWVYEGHQWENGDHLDYQQTIAGPSMSNFLQSTPNPKSHSLFSEAGEEGAAAVSVATTTAMGMGKFLYERPDDHCRVFELSWKLAGGSKALLYSFKD